MSVYLAIDAGGTKTDYLLADEARELGRVRGATIKRLTVSAETAAARLDEALGELSASTGVPLSAVTSTCVGTAGESVPLVVDWLREALGERVAGELLVLGDVEIALDAAFPGQPGVLILAGTGSNVAGRSHTGSLTTVGGWGPVLGDQGSGYHIGLRALRAIFRAMDEAPTNADASMTALLAAVLEHWQLADVPSLVAYANASNTPELASLTEVVLRCAEAGDAVAAQVLREEGDALAELGLLAIQRLRLQSPDSDWLPSVAFAGSVMECVGPVRQAVSDRLLKTYPAITLVPGVVDPIQGALWRARSLGARREDALPTRSLVEDQTP